MPPYRKLKLKEQAALATLLSAALPASSLAAVAGRVDFAIGPVTATDPDGKQRVLAKGSRVLSGDRIETRTGRAQIRFTDDAYVSLQPQTDFRVDDYNYEGKTDGREKGFFSLLKGGLRTITGAIGRVNRRTYRVSTPVATIGIRGTEYAAEIGSLTVTVRDGEVEICNNAGCHILYRGETGFVENIETVLQLLQSQGVDVQVEEGVDETVYTIGDDVDSQGKSILPPIVQQTTQQGPDCSQGNCELVLAFSDDTQGSGIRFADGGEGSGQVTGSFDSAGALLSYMDAGGNNGSVGGATAQSAGSDDIIGWGRWTGGSTSGSFPHPMNLGPGEGFHYVIGIATADMPTTGMATYNLLGFTTPTFSDGVGDPGSGPLGTGTVASGSTLTANFGMGTVDTSMSVVFPSTSYNLNFSGLGIDRFTFSGFGNATSPGVDCNCFGCSTSIKGFFAGSNAARAGLVYDISSEAASFSIDGAATFTKQ